MNFDPNAILVPPEAQKAQSEADSMFAVVDAYDVDSPAMYEAAGAELQTIRAKFAAIEKQRVHVKEPFLEGCRRIDAFFKVPLDRLTDAGNLLKGRMLTFQQSEREKAEKARREAEEAARKERAEQERIRREAEEKERQIRAAAAEAQRKADAEAAAARKAGDEEAARAAEEAARIAAEEAAQAASACVAEAEQAHQQIELAEIAPVAVPAVIAPKAAGIGTRENWKAEVVDFAALVTAAAAALANGDTTLLGYLQADTKAIGQVARALKAQARIPGVRIYAEESLSVRTA
ncbi:hypothetical protein [Dokdonella soli]|uniref:DUF1351 domain-containing protein n=1 Tax=Dokdonella soli TaxID=529810 RepID=A0ABP3U3A9_9GAMM